MYTKLASPLPKMQCINVLDSRCVGQTPRHGCLSSCYHEEGLAVPPVVDAVDLWRFAHNLTMAHNTAKANRLALR